MENSKPTKASKIIVPKPGELLMGLGASGALVDAAEAAAAVAAIEAKLAAEKQNEAIWNAWEVSALSAFADKPAIDAVNDFTRMKMREDGFYKKIMPPIPIANDELDKCVYTDEPVKIVSPIFSNPPGWYDNVPDIKDVMAAQPMQNADLGVLASWFREAGVDIAFWYYRDTDLIYSVRRVKDDYFYDFANKQFRLVPVVPPAGMPGSEPIRPVGFVYSTRLSGRLADGEYIVTYRDSQADDVVVGVMAVFMKGGKQQQVPPRGLENTPIEPGLPAPCSMFRRAERVRSVDV